MPEANTAPLSECITKGIAMRPKRATGIHFAGNDRSDVLGAAYQGFTGDEIVHNYQVDGVLERNFPLLKKTVDCPECGERKRNNLKAIIVHLNDKHRWKRKNTARFVRSVEERATLVEGSEAV